MTTDINYLIELSEKKPEDVCRRALCTYDDIGKFYTVCILGKDYRIYPHEQKIFCIQDEYAEIDEFLGLFIMYYMLNSKEVLISKEWISEKDILGGPLFFRGMHEIPSHYIAKRYGKDIQKFRDRCRQCDGMPLSMADASYSFKAAPRIPVVVQLWEEDDEFPAKSKMLFDKSISEHLPLEVIFALAVSVCKRILRDPH